MNKLIFCSLLTLSAHTLFAQKIVEVSYEKDSKGHYQFSCNNHAFCNYILEIGFSQLTNLKSDHSLPYRAMVRPGTSKLFSLTPENAADPIQMNYGSKFSKGCINPSVDTAFTYLLPISPGKEAQAYKMENADPAVNGWYVIRLKMRPGDTIYAARMGTITEVEDKSGVNDEGRSDANEENYIEVVHRDCSFGHYGIIKKDGALVKPGQPVKAGQPIALVGGDKYGRGSDLKFSVYYNGDESDWKYVPLQFWTKNNGKGKLKHGAVYTSEFPRAVVNQEMPKKPAGKAALKKKKP